MKNIVEALLIVWPRGIPSTEYERALSLAAKFGALAPSLSVKAAPAASPVTAERLEASAKPKSSTYRVGRPTIDKVREMLGTGEATGKEIAEATGISTPNVMAALRLVGVHVATRRRTSGFGRGAKVWALKGESK